MPACHSFSGARVVISSRTQSKCEDVVNAAAAAAAAGTSFEEERAFAISADAGNVEELEMLVEKKP